MMAKLRHPAAAAALGVVLSVGLGTAMVWRTLGEAVVRTAAARTEKPPPEELKRKGWDFWTIEVENLATELKEERARLQKQSELLEQRAARLAAEERDFARLRADVEALRREIGAKVVEIAADESKNLRTLSATYTALSPKAAVAIFREMDDATAVKILSLMKPETVGPIFEEMSRTGAADTALARRAAQLSEKLRLMKAAKSGPAS
jgi:flagellar motility protein MotE (MotC chaperone)